VLVYTYKMIAYANTVAGHAILPQVIRTM